MPASLSFAKIVASPTETAWSQVYHAGNLFALVSLTTEKDGTDLNALGKEMFNTLESNFFSLEKKNLGTITEVLEDSLKELPATVAVSACIAFSREAILYLFLIGEGDIYMKREDKIGVILSRKTHEGRKVHSSSGFLNHGDVLLMQTGSFSKLVSYDQIKEAFQGHLPNEVTEKLTTPETELPGDASAVALLYQGASSPDALTPAQEMRRTLQSKSPLEDEETQEEDDDQPEKEIPHKTELAEKEEELEEETSPDELDEESSEESVSDEELPHRLSPEDRDERDMKAWKTDHLPVDISDEHEEQVSSPVTVTKKRFALPLPSKRIMIGLVALVLLLVLIFSIFLTKQTKQNSETKVVYEETLEQATKKYDEAEGLKNLNASLAQDDYKQAATLIKNALPKLKKGSAEEKELSALLAKIEQNIETTEGATVETKAVDLSESPLLSLAVEKKATAIATDDEKAYALTAQAVTEGDKELIKNDDDWSSVAGFGAYNGNIYILDKKEGILKFSAGSDGYGKSSYFSGDAPSLTNASGMGIDGSIYVLFTDGKVKKYTKGKEESFVLSGLPTPFNSPKQLLTGVDWDSLYVLDSGNSRVVKLSKDGAFEKAWKAEGLGSTSYIDVQENEKKIYFLKGKNLFMLSME